MDLRHGRSAQLRAELRPGGAAADCPAMAQRAAETDATYPDFPESVPRAETETRRARARARARETLARAAGSPAVKTLDGHDAESAAGAPRHQIRQLAGLGFAERTENVVPLGPSGVGRTRPAIALGHLAAQAGIKTRFTPAADLVLQLETAQRQGRLEEALHRTVSHRRLLAIDEIGCLPLTQGQASRMFRVVSRRHGRGAILPAPDLTSGAWDRASAGDAAPAAAMPDRLTHRAAVAQTAGKGHRPKGKRKEGVAPKATTGANS